MSEQLKPLQHSPSYSVYSIINLNRNVESITELVNDHDLAF